MAHLQRDTDAMMITIGCPELINGREEGRVLAEVGGSGLSGSGGPSVLFVIL